MVSAFVENSIQKLSTKRQLETGLHHGYIDFLPKTKRPNVITIRQSSSGYGAADFQMTWRKSEDDLGDKLNSAAPTTEIDEQSSLGYMFHPGESSTGVSRATTDRRKGEGDSMVHAGGRSCAYANAFKNANQAKNIDALTSLAPMSQSQPFISPRIKNTESEDDPITDVAVKCSNTLVQHLNSAVRSKSKHINVGVDAANLQALVPVPEYVSKGNSQSRNYPVQPNFPVVLGARNSSSFSKHCNFAKGTSITEEHLEVNHEGCYDNIVGRELNGVTIPSTDGNKVMNALNDFKATVTELSKELEGKSNMGNFFVYRDAAMLMKKRQQWVNTRNQFGAVSGVNIGDKFQFRAELVIIGLHCRFQNGIDYMEKNGQLLATSIVDSGRYSNDMESTDVLIYSGQGGNPMVGTRQIEDQKLVGGNLALHNSISEKNPIRVIFKSRKKNLPKYTYDGLYVVNKAWKDRGQFGKLVFKFKLKRIAGQPRITRGIVEEHSEENWRKMNKSKNSKECKSWCLNDMSQGKEKMPIRVVNTIDNEKLPSFKYMTNMIYPEWCNFSLPSGCDCIDGCSKKCPCALKNGGEFAFDNNGAIVKEKPLVYECGPSCKCYSTCHNRVSQHGIRISLEVFKTKSKGWGVRSRSYISSGRFICEYVGKLLLDKEAEGRIGNDEYLFDIGGRDNDTILGDGPIPLLHSELSSSNCMDDGSFTLDAAQYGNVARFINHSCSPNIFAQNVLYDHDDRRAPHIMLFATKNIPPSHELTYDYNYAIGNVYDSSGNVKIKNCYCGSFECNGRMY